MRTMHAILAFLTIVCALAPPADALTVNPSSVDFGVLRQGTSPAKTFQVKNDGNAALDLVISSSRPEFKPRATELRLEPGATKSVTVDILKTAAPGSYTGKIALKEKGVRPRGAAAAEVNMQAIVTMITANPAITDVGSKSAPLVNQNFTVNIKNEGPVPLNCTTAPQPAGPGGLLTIAPSSMTLAPGQQTALTVTFNSKNITQKTFDIAGAAKCAAGTTTMQAEFHIKGSYNVFVVNAPKNGAGGTTLNGQVTGNAFAAAGGVLVCNDVGGTGGGAFGSGGAAGVFTCFGALGGGSQVSLTVAVPPTANFKWTGATGSAASCNNSTATTCSFTLGADSNVTATFTPK